MTQRLPVVGSDDNNWGSILNGFLAVSLNSDGTLLTAAVSTAGAEMTSHKGAASGYASLNTSTVVPTAQLGSGTASTSTFLRGDNTWVAPVTSVNGSTGAVTGLLVGSNNLSDIGTAATARTNLGLGTAAVAAIDATATDIKALGTQAAGSSGKVADASHVHPTTGLALLTGASFTGNVSTTGTLSTSESVTAGVVALTDATTISVNAALGNHFRVTLGGNRTLGNPTNPVDGQKITFEIIQDATGSRTLAYGTSYAFSTDIPSPTLTTTASKRDFLGFVYNATTSLWYLLAVVHGF